VEHFKFLTFLAFLWRVIFNFFKLFLLFLFFTILLPKLHLAEKLEIHYKNISLVSSFRLICILLVLMTSLNVTSPIWLLLNFQNELGFISTTIVKTTKLGKLLDYIVTISAYSQEFSMGRGWLLPEAIGCLGLPALGDFYNFSIKITHFYA